MTIKPDDATTSLNECAGVGTDLQKGVKWNDSTARVIECSGKQNGSHKT